MNLELLETEFLIAPLRDFKYNTVRGYFKPELIEKYKLTPKQFKKMSRSKIFKWAWRTYEGEPSQFYTLR